MANLEQALFTELNSIATLTNKVFPVYAQQATTPPYAVYVMGRVDREEELLGHNGLIGASYDINVFDTSYSSMKSIMDSIVAKIKTFSQATIGGTGPFIQQAKIENEFENYQDNVKLYHGIIETTLYYQE